MFKLTRWSIRRTFKLAIMTALFAMAIAGISPASAQTRSVTTAGVSPASAQTRSASGKLYLNTTYDQCSRTVVTVFSATPDLQVYKGDTVRFRIPFSTHWHRVFWSCGSTPEATWVPPFTNYIVMHRQHAYEGRQITWTSYYAY